MRPVSFISVRLTFTVVIVMAAIDYSATPVFAASSAWAHLLQPETDLQSLRHTLLTTSYTLSSEVVRKDIDTDGDPDLVERWWNRKRCRWFDLNDNMQPTHLSGDLADDLLQVDYNNDGFYDGPEDINLRWVDTKNGGKADVQFYTQNPGQRSEDLGRYMVYFDNDGDNTMIFLEWKSFTFDSYRARNSTRLPIDIRSNYLEDYSGDSLFLWNLMAPALQEDARWGWENPFCFYDTDGDGCTEYSVRMLDNPIFKGTPRSNGLYWSERMVDDVMVSYDIDNDSQRGNETDYDLSLKMDRGETIDYSKMAFSSSKLRAPEWVLPYFRSTSWLTLNELYFVPHDKAYELSFKPKWGRVSMTFDEDDDDHRWERVELSTPGDPYSTKRWKYGDSPQDQAKCGIGGHPQADSLGDRGEWDADNSGGARLYVGFWDQKLHLYGAEWGAWTVDYDGRYWGSEPVHGDSSRENARRVEEVVHYRDTDNDGYFDHLVYDYDGDKQPELSVSLLSLGDQGTSSPYPDTKLLDPATLEYSGLHREFARIAEESWQEAYRVYMAAWQAGLDTDELDDLAIVSSTWEKQHNAYWLKEKVFRDCCSRLKHQGEKQLCEQLIRSHFSGDTTKVCRLISEHDWSGQ